MNNEGNEALPSVNVHKTTQSPNSLLWWLERARERLQVRAIGDAIKAYRVALRIEPGHSVALHALAQLLELSGDYAAAIESYSQLLEADHQAGSLEMLTGIGHSWMALGDFERARSVLHSAVKLQQQQLTCRSPTIKVCAHC